MSTILVPLDGSGLAEQPLAYVRTLAPLLGADVLLLRVVPDTALDQGGALGYDLAAAFGVSDAVVARREYEQRMAALLRDQALSYLEQQAGALEAAGIAVRVEVRAGPPAEVIVEAAAAAHVSLIAMATHGYSGVKRWALGSIADKVVHATCTPVLLVRADHPPAPERLRHILLPLDGSPLARQALPLAAELARASGAELELARVIVPTLEITAGMPPGGRVPVPVEDLTETLRESALADLEGLAAALRPEVGRVIVSAPVGAAAETIVDEAARRGADLIIMATHGYSGVRRWALGSVADKVLHATCTPLILVRAKV